MQCPFSSSKNTCLRYHVHVMQCPCCMCTVFAEASVTCLQGMGNALCCLMQLPLQEFFLALSLTINESCLTAAVGDVVGCLIW